jgi:hypothetical protein
MAEPADLGFDEYEDDDKAARLILEIEDTVGAHSKLLNQSPAYHQIINAEVSLQLGDSMSTVMVTKRAVGPDSTMTGSYDSKPYLNSMIYEVEFPDGQVKEYAANLIAENMLTQVDSDGYSITMMDGIVDYKRDNAVTIAESDMHMITLRGQKRMRKMTQGWELLIRWANQSDFWIALKDMKESHPVETAEFTRARDIADEPAFAWWVPYTLRKRDIILCKFKPRRPRTPHKYGIEVPTS